MTSMPLDIFYPNNVLTDEFICEYNEQFDAVPQSPVPVQFPSWLDTPPDRDTYIQNSHRGPNCVPCSSPQSCNIASHRLTANPFSFPAEYSSLAPSDAVDVGLSSIASPVLGHVPADDTKDSPTTASCGLLSSFPALWSAKPDDSISPTPSSPSQSWFTSLFNSLFSSVPSIPSSHDLIPTFLWHDGWTAVDSMLGDATLRISMRFFLYSVLHTYQLSLDDVLPCLDSGASTWRIRTPVCYIASRALNSLANFILCAANDHNPWHDGGRPDIPQFIDTSLLEELGLRIPGIILFRNYSDRNIHDARFASAEDGLAYIQWLKTVYTYYLLWIANAIRISVQFGYHSSWRWGAAMSMSHTEWTHRITRHFVYDGYKSLERFMAHQLLRNDMDFGCAMLLGPSHGVRLLSIIRAERAHLAMWPLTDPISEEGDLFVRHRLHEIGSSIPVLNQLVIDNEP
jgi:hypothetical protein